MFIYVIFIALFFNLDLRSFFLLHGEGHQHDSIFFTPLIFFARWVSFHDAPLDFFPFTTPRRAVPPATAGAPAAAAEGDTGHTGADPPPPDPAPATASLGSTVVCKYDNNIIQ